MSKKKKFKNEKKVKSEIGYFICPKCNTVHVRKKDNFKYSYLNNFMVRDYANGIDIWNFYCPYDHERLNEIDEKIIPLALLLNNLEIKFIDYQYKLLYNYEKYDFDRVPFIAISTELSENGKKNLDKLKNLIKNKPKLKNWYINQEINTFKTCTYENKYDEEEKKVATIETPHIIKFISICLIQPKNKNFNNKYIDDSIKYLLKALQTIEKDGITDVDLVI